MKKNAKKWIATALATVATVSLTACGGSADTQEATADSGETTVVKVGVVGEYNAQWDTINELLADDGIQVELVKFTDYAAPNRALNDGEIDLNAFQHKAFLANDIQQKGYDIVDIGDTIIAPLGIYNNKDKISSIEEIKDGDVIAIPSDLTNGGRALNCWKQLESSNVTLQKALFPQKQTSPNTTNRSKLWKQNPQHWQICCLTAQQPSSTAAMLSQQV